MSEAGEDGEPWGLARIEAELEKLGYVATLWHTDEIRELRPDLEAQQAKDVLTSIRECKDFRAEIIEWHAERLYPVYPAAEVMGEAEYYDALIESERRQEEIRQQPHNTPAPDADIDLPF